MRNAYYLEANLDLGTGQDRSKRVDLGGRTHIGGQDIFLVLRDGEGPKRKQRGGDCVRCADQSALPAE